MTRYIGLAEYMWLAELVTGIDTAPLIKASRVELADSALHAPAAGLGDDDFYPDIYDKAAVLTCRLAWNHPLLDGNKRAAWAALLMFVYLNGGRWDPDPPDTHQAVEAMLALAAGGRPRRLVRRLASPASPIRRRHRRVILGPFFTPSLRCASGAPQLNRSSAPTIHAGKRVRSPSETARNAESGRDRSHNRIWAQFLSAVENDRAQSG